MILYHGSNMRVEKPVLKTPSRPLDFSAGFYTSESREQAERWAFSKQKRMAGSMEGTKAILNSYEMADELFTANKLVVKEFRIADEEWLEFIVQARSSLQICHSYDMVKGPVANDNLFQTINLYETGILNKAETIARLKTHRLYGQVSFHTPAALSQLRFLEAMELG